MAKQFEVYKCNHCGLMVEALNTAGPAPSCCGEAMALKKEGTSDGAVEKHLPVIEKTATGFTVSVGSAPHVMTEEHWIEWIELSADGACYRKYLKPGDEPVAEFAVSGNPSDVSAREYCNLHGLWKA